MASDLRAGLKLVAENLERLDRQILELVGCDVDLGAERFESRAIVDRPRE